MSYNDADAISFEMQGGIVCGRGQDTTLRYHGARERYLRSDICGLEHGSVRNEASRAAPPGLHPTDGSLSGSQTS
jgi:hypothetical protein